jgi:hypothetical protein
VSGARRVEAAEGEAEERGGSQPPETGGRQPPPPPRSPEPSALDPSGVHTHSDRCVKIALHLLRVAGPSDRVEPGQGPGKGGEVATPERRYGPGAGITLGGIIVIVGIILMFVLNSIWFGLIVVLIGLLAFGGFARGRWY